MAEQTKNSASEWGHFHWKKKSLLPVLLTQIATRHFGHGLIHRSWCYDSDPLGFVSNRMKPIYVPAACGGLT